MQSTSSLTFYRQLGSITYFLALFNKANIVSTHQSINPLAKNNLIKLCLKAGDQDFSTSIFGCDMAFHVQSAWEEPSRTVIHLIYLVIFKFMIQIKVRLKPLIRINSLSCVAWNLNISYDKSAILLAFGVLWLVLSLTIMTHCNVILQILFFTLQHISNRLLGNFGLPSLYSFQVWLLNHVRAHTINYYNKWFTSSHHRIQSGVSIWNWIPGPASLSLVSYKRRSDKGFDLKWYNLEIILGK